MKKDLQQLIIEEFSSASTQEEYARLAGQGKGLTY